MRDAAGAWYNNCLVRHAASESDQARTLFSSGIAHDLIHDKNSGIVLWVRLERVKCIKINVVSTTLYAYICLMFIYNYIQANVYATLLEIQHILSLCHVFVVHYYVWIWLRSLNSFFMLLTDHHRKCSFWFTHSCAVQSYLFIIKIQLLTLKKKKKNSDFDNILENPIHPLCQCVYGAFAGLCWQL